MKFAAAFVVIAVVCCSISTCQSSPLRSVVTSNVKFSRDFAQAISPQAGNLVSSPLSAQMALGMTYLGARGSTASTMRTALSLPENDEDVKNGFRKLIRALQVESRNGVMIKLANRIFVRKGFEINQEFIAATRQGFKSAASSLDFDKPKAHEVINKWVESQTEGKITDLVPEGSLDADARLVLVNAMYLQALWATEFDSDDTIDSSFYTSDTNSKFAPFMRREGNITTAEINDLNATLIELPYQSDKLSMVVLIPGTKSGLATLEKKMQTYDLSALVESAKGEWIELWLPKFKIESSIDLKDPLVKLGMGIALDKSQADFSGISSSESLYISEALQKVFINVAENGTEAAAATSIKISARSGKFGYYPVVAADHPFLFYVVHRTSPRQHTVLFSGRVTDPQVPSN